MYITLYRKYRPKSFEEVYGEDAIIKTIKNSLKKDRLAHAYLFTGPRGVGKTTTARLIAKGLNCMTNGITDDPCNECENCNAIDKGNFFDLIEIDAASNRGIDEIRELKDKINYKPVKGVKKVYIIDEVHMLTKEAFNALLKTLEEPPSHVIFILATTEPDKILDTIISRCQRYDFLPLSFENAYKRLKDIAEKESIVIDEGSIRLIYEKSGGSLRDAISIFEKVISACFQEEITKEKTEDALGVIPENKIIEFIDIIKNEELDNGVNFLDDLWNVGINVDEFFRDFAYYLKDMMINKDEKFQINEYVTMIEQVFDTASKFRFEEDKRLLGYVILYKILNKEGATQVKIVEKIIEKVETKIVEQPSSVKRTKEYDNVDVDVTIGDITQKWREILETAKNKKISLMAFLGHTKPLKLTKNNLVVGFPFDNRFHRNSMKKPENNMILVDILKDIFEVHFNIKYEIIGMDESKEENQTDLVSKMVDFFEGEII